MSFSLCLSLSRALAATTTPQAVFNILKQSDAGDVDYLLIETSGASDPISMINTLEAECVTRAGPC